MNEEENISRVLANLPRVEAPENFEGSVRSRIAEERPSDSTVRPFALLGLKFALPLIILLFVGAFLILSDDGSLDQAAVPPVGNDQPNAPSIDLPKEIGTQDVAASKTARPSPTVNRRANVSQELPMSEDQALSPDDSTLFPRGVDPRRANISNSKLPEGGPISPASILSMLGIDANCSRSGCMATEVRSGSIAERSGVRAGDLIEAIDDRPIGSSTQLQGTVTAGSLSVLRGGQRLTLRLNVR